MPEAFIDWTWQTWLPANLHRYEKQIAEHIAYIDLKIDGLNKDLEHIAGGVLDDRDAAAASVIASSVNLLQQHCSHEQHP